MAALTEIEHQVLLFIQRNLRLDFLTPFMKGVSFLGNAGWFFILLTLLLMCYPKTRKYGIMMAAALLVDVLLVNVGLKNIFHRIRPYDTFLDLELLVARETDFSFPSGHSGCAFAAAIALLSGLPKGKKFWGILLTILAGFVAWSRLYVAVHYPTDVVAGVLIGILCGWIGVWLYQHVIERWIQDLIGKRQKSVR